MSKNMTKKTEWSRALIMIATLEPHDVQQLKQPFSENVKY